MPTLEVSEEEAKQIYQQRADAEHRLKTEEFLTNALKAAAAFQEWSNATGYSLTISTFVSDFGYQNGDNEKMYRAVQRILEAATDVTQLLFRKA